MKLKLTDKKYKLHEFERGAESDIFHNIWENKELKKLIAEQKKLKGEFRIIVTYSE